MNSSIGGIRQLLTKVNRIAGACILSTPGRKQIHIQCISFCYQPFFNAAEAIFRLVVMVSPCVYIPEVMVLVAYSNIVISDVKCSRVAAEFAPALRAACCCSSH